MNYIKVVFENEEFNFITVDERSLEELKDDYVGTSFDFSFRGGNIENCIDVIF